MRNVMSWIKKGFSDLIIIVFSIIFAFTIFLIFDFSYNLFTKVKVEPCGIARESGFYELKRDCNGSDRFYENIFPVFTDRFGFRVKNNAIKTVEKAEVIFLGDSFTFGVNGSWDQTFVGMFEEQTSKKVINAGLGSYSPTVYAYQYKKALNANLLDKPHTVVIALDISDVQDEAGLWEKGKAHPIKMEYTRVMKRKQDEGSNKIITAIKKSLPFTRTVYHYITQTISSYEIEDEIANLPRSAFTFIKWTELELFTAAPDHKGYLPLGVQGGIDKIISAVEKINNIAQENNGRVAFLIYPWPAQMVHAQSVFVWNDFVKRLCDKIKCAGVIDTFGAFETELSEGVGFNNIYKLGDVHFTENGNKILAEYLIPSYQEIFENEVK
jgi:hypothetical protein